MLIKKTGEKMTYNKNLEIRLEQIINRIENKELDGARMMRLATKLIKTNKKEVKKYIKKTKKNTLQNSLAQSILYMISSEKERRQYWNNPLTSITGKLTFKGKYAGSFLTNNKEKEGSNITFKGYKSGNFNENNGKYSGSHNENNGEYSGSNNKNNGYKSALTI